jgi:hypothetical protein
MTNVKSTAAPSSPFVVHYDEIPPSPEGARTHLKVRPFAGGSLLDTLVPGRGVALELVQLPAGEQAARRASARCLFIVLEGGAELLAGGHRAVHTGDTITFPESFAYGLTAGPKGLEALVVSFPNVHGETVREVLTFEQLLARNQARTQASLEKAFFRMLAGGALRAPAARGRFCDCLRVFSDALQTLRRERGHADLLAGPDAGPAAFDPVLSATASWFCNQMFVLDDLDKTVVNLVLETAGGNLHKLAAPMFAGDPRAKYFEAQVADRARRKLGLDVLQGQPPQVYRRLAAVLERSWEMFEAMTGRIVELVEKRTEGVTHGS